MAKTNTQCKQCGYSWFSRKKAMGDGKPVECPNCKRVDWDKPKKEKLHK